MVLHNTVVDEDDGPPPGWSPQLRPSTPPQEMAQMVCGSCRLLLAYPIRATRVQCSSCQTLNFVLQEHEVGHVKCGSCSLLLMYPYGAPSVRCSSCRSVTEIGDHNKHPPWLEQQGHTPETPNPAH